MNKDAHYYAVLALCRACGFNKESAHVIAYASQFVDDAKINLIFFDGPSIRIEHDIVENRPAFFNMATCHSYFRVKTFNYEAMINNTSAFHFVPGCKGENFTKKLRCMEESPVILDILKDVLLKDDLIKLGIVLHAYVDTFSHQGFSGILSKVNDIKNCEAKTEAHLGMLDRILQMLKQLTQGKYEDFFDRIIPAYGHAQALEFPDIPYLVWSYEYDYSDEFNGSYKMVEIDNKDRYKRAFNNVKTHLDLYLKKHQQYVDSNLRFGNFDKFMEVLLTEGPDIKREENWAKFLIEYGLFNTDDQNLLNYEENGWLKQAFANFDPHVFDSRKVEIAQLADNFINSYWYHFYLSVKWYKRKFFEYCSKYQLSIPN